MAKGRREKMGMLQPCRANARLSLDGKADGLHFCSSFELATACIPRMYASSCFQRVLWESICPSIPRVCNAIGLKVCLVQADRPA
jgi:hypothetical protein